MGIVLIATVIATLCIVAMVRIGTCKDPGTLSTMLLLGFNAAFLLLFIILPAVVGK